MPNFETIEPATFRMGFETRQEEQEIKYNRITIKNAQGIELQILIDNNGTFKISLDDLVILPQASNYVHLKSIRLRDKG